MEPGRFPTSPAYIEPDRRPAAMSGPIVWLRNGKMLSLWFLSRLLFALGVLGLIGEVIAGLMALISILFVADEIRTGFWFKSSATATALAGMIVFSINIFLFFFGSAVTVYLAARNDREASEFHVPPESGQGGPPAQP